MREYPSEAAVIVYLLSGLSRNDVDFATAAMCFDVTHSDFLLTMVKWLWNVR